MSLPVRERGLKSPRLSSASPVAPVAPRAGAWVEIRAQRALHRQQSRSLPVRERGLK